MTETVCSDLGHEPLPGTAKGGVLLIARASVWVEPTSSMAGCSARLTARIKDWLAGGGSLQLGHKPGRLGQIPCDGVTMYVAHCPRIDAPDGAGAGEGAAFSAPRLEVRTVCDVEEMLSLDVRLGRPTEGSRRRRAVVAGVHARQARRCCAVKGRPIAQALNNVHPDAVWETSHSRHQVLRRRWCCCRGITPTGGCRRSRRSRCLTTPRRESLHAGGCRGRGVWDARGQVAELAARGEVDEWAIDAVARWTFADVVDAVLDEGGGHSAGDARAAARGAGACAGRRCRRRRGIRRRPHRRRGPRADVTEGVVSSCGDAPGPKKGWRALALKRRS